jgi:hypothetical protein
MVHARRSWEPPRLFSWTVRPPDDDGPGAVGVTDDEQLALEHAGEALLDAPAGSRGEVYRATPSDVRIAFVYDGLIARGRLDPKSGRVVWEHLRGSLEGVVHGIPPEGLAAGRYDLAKESKRRRILGMAAEFLGVPRR